MDLHLKLGAPYPIIVLQLKLKETLVNKSNDNKPNHFNGTFPLPAPIKIVLHTIVW